MKDYIIKRNAIKCKHCGDIIESNYTHDSKHCSCGTCGIDGGHDYLKRRCKSINEDDDIIELSEIEEIEVSDEEETWL